MKLVIRVLWLTIIWLVLWSDISVANVLSGLVVAALVVASFDTWLSGRAVIRPIPVARFALHFLVQLTLSTITVTRTVIAPRDRIHSGILAVPLLECSDAVATLIADAISLTPGTLTLEVRRDPLTLYVHALDLRDADALLREIRTLEVLAIKAFGDDQALAGLAGDDPRTRRPR